jgi:hypothetical protein
MTDLELSLGFDCCACENPVYAKVHCTGEGLAAGRMGAVAAVKAACPMCGQDIQICFDTRDSRVVLVRPMPMPAMN